jgi:hypothetical protein
MLGYSSKDAVNSPVLYPAILTSQVIYSPFFPRNSVVDYLSNLNDHKMFPQYF